MAVDGLRRGLIGEAGSSDAKQRDDGQNDRA